MNKNTEKVSRSEINGVTVTESQMFRYAMLLYGKTKQISTAEQARSVLLANGHSVKAV